MKFIAPIIFVVVVIAALHGQFLIAGAFSIYFSLIASALWLIPVAFLIDGYFAAFYEVPWLSISTVALYAIIELVRPYITWHTKDTL